MTEVMTPSPLLTPVSPANTYTHTHKLTRIHAGFAVTETMTFTSTESHVVESQQSSACFYIQINTDLMCLHYEHQLPQSDLREPELLPVFTLVCSPEMGEFEDSKQTRERQKREYLPEE